MFKGGQSALQFLKSISLLSHDLILGPLQFLNLFSLPWQYLIFVSIIHTLILMAADASGASSSCSSYPRYPSYPNYDVFLNHRGPDLKDTFANDLYRALNSRGLRVFLDKPEMHVGHQITPQIESAIRVASVQVAIFSKTYLESRWCLDELILMVDCFITGRATIIPVFYDLEPSVLRHKWNHEARGNLQNKKNYDSQVHEQNRPRYESRTDRKSVV